MSEREVVVCAQDPACGSLGPEHHGWGCPLSDPVGDVLRPLMGAHPNPILDGARREMLDRWLPHESPTNPD